MKNNDYHAPLFHHLSQFINLHPISFHVPGHKNGTIFPDHAKEYFQSVLQLDLTELNGLDDLHAPKGVIAEAEQLASEYFQADHTFFLVGGSTVGNLAMILAVCSPGDKIIVQRNSHKSIMNGLELSGANPIFINPEYDSEVERYHAPSYQTVSQAIHMHPDAKALVLTYPDYFGQTYAIQELIELAHSHGIPVFVDEAHGVHFSLGEPFPPSALVLGADVVVQSAHKMAPAMTMSSYLHMKSNMLSKEAIAHYLQMLQSSSPSYPLMASLDLSRSFLATLSSKSRADIFQSVEQLRNVLQLGTHWKVLLGDDPLKITLHVNKGISGFEVAQCLENEGIYPELATTNQVLLIHGLGVFDQLEKVEKVIKTINEQLKYEPNHATIDISRLFREPIQELALSHQMMRQMDPIQIPLTKAKGFIAAEAIIPYPPGIPLVAKGERITEAHIEIINQLIEQGATIQHRHIEEGIQVFSV
ncbi:aminotransferase class I/II-fold pyridoxal phosphate-dependent enzyme [Ornithinibacillus sp. L9]|uniref:Aminotransferase class I/II-fold pyridoxal phosphate-dependent enzyme n=1 Tax=Ornithinibacillus caprae TaxID=2678566 RepID=A0A6N8FJE7_9BACI|nr:aminotransferase class I/II-fold pyridoxal phosphate-dependent enzyme [Ornithinibacillus caprae]MUK88097.1 aminotransferase class I/II-fold pyridoxal phosphate-dependent enzyme [Ornithinibacillus caprae]